MGDALTNEIGVGLNAQDPGAARMEQPIDFIQIYDQERDKRTRAEGTAQYIDLAKIHTCRSIVEDPWIETGMKINTPVSNDGHCKVLVLGAGFGGILFAIRCIQAGIDKNDILIVDPAGGFGGTWYWNRYPGLMCDVESHIYLPLIEEMNYMPKRRYASGVEIREYVESLCSRYGLHERAMFQSTVRSAVWNDGSRQWDIKILKKPKGGDESEHILHASFVTLSPGLLSNAKLPNVRGIDTFEGHMFHTARWDYSYTGGSPSDPQLTGLEGKRVGVVGTGATCIQALPEIAKFASKIYVFQRTPSSVDARDNRDTDATWFNTKVATKPGWQRERRLNFVKCTQNDEPDPDKDLVDDGWSKMPSFSGIIGTAKEVTMENVADHIGELHALDYPRTMRIHSRVDSIVKDPDTANRLKPWYPGWCKRPCFHDEYLQTFNRSNVELVDTDGKGLECVNADGIRAAGKDYRLDLIIWMSGFRSPALGSAAGKAEISVIGRGGVDMEEQSMKGELLTLHGCIGRNFPNMLWNGPWQAGNTGNNTFAIDTTATHVAYIIAQAVKRSPNAVVEPTEAAEAQWAMQIASGAVTFAAVAGCTPSYSNREGELNRMTLDQQMNFAKLGPWPHGFESYLNVLEQWRADGKMEGLEISSAA